MAYGDGLRKVKEIARAKRQPGTMNCARLPCVTMRR